MFGKLIKYELKSVGKWYVGLSVGMLIIAPLLGFVLKNNFQDVSDSVFMSANDYMSMLLTMVFVAMIVGLSLATLLMIITRFNRNIYGREGYLTLTLPVSTHQLLLSKVLTSFLWSILNLFVFLFSAILVALPSIGIADLLAALPRLRPYLFSSQAGLILILLIISTFSSILLIYLAISIGQLFQDRRGLMGFVAYFTISIMMSFTLNIFNNSILLADILSETHELGLFFINKFLIISILEDLLLCTVYYFATHYIMKNKVNIQ